MRKFNPAGLKKEVFQKSPVTPGVVRTSGFMYEGRMFLTVEDINDYIRKEKLAQLACFSSVLPFYYKLKEIFAFGLVAPDE